MVYVVVGIVVVDVVVCGDLFLLVVVGAVLVVSIVSAGTVDGATWTPFNAHEQQLQRSKGVRSCLRSPPGWPDVLTLVLVY